MRGTLLPSPPHFVTELHLSVYSSGFRPSQELAPVWFPKYGLAPLVGNHCTKIFITNSVLERFQFVIFYIDSVLQRFEFYRLRFQLPLLYSWSLRQGAGQRKAPWAKERGVSAVTGQYLPHHRTLRYNTWFLYSMFLTLFRYTSAATSDVTNLPGNVIHQDFSPTKLHSRGDNPLWRTVMAGGLHVSSVCRGDIEGDMGWWLGWYQLFGSTMLWGLVFRQLCLRTILPSPSSEHSKNSILSCTWTVMKMEPAQGQVAGSCECGNEPPGSFLTSWEYVSFWRRILFHGVIHSGNGTSLSLSTSAFPCHCHPTIAPSLSSCHRCCSIAASGSGDKIYTKKGISSCMIIQGDKKVSVHRFSLL